MEDDQGKKEEEEEEWKREGIEIERQGKRIGKRKINKERKRVT